MNSDVHVRHIDHRKCKPGDLVWALRPSGYAKGIISDVPEKRTAQMILFIQFGERRELKYAFDCYERDDALEGSDKPEKR